MRTAGNTFHLVSLGVLLFVVLFVLIGPHVIDLSFASQGEDAGEQWNYLSDKGPGKWSSLSNRFTGCAKGKLQSPIDISGAIESDMGGLEVSYFESKKLFIVNSGRLVEAEFDEGNYITIDNLKYELRKVQFHSPSEHTVDGRRFDMEIYFFHVSPAGKVVIVSLLVTEGEFNWAFDSIWAKIPDRENHEYVYDKFAFPAILPANTAFYKYSGSFTTPPCREPVTYYILTTPVGLSAEQIEAFRAKLDGPNYRPLQPLNKRKVRVSR